MVENRIIKENGFICDPDVFSDKIFLEKFKMQAGEQIGSGSVCLFVCHLGFFW